MSNLCKTTIIATQAAVLLAACAAGANPDEPTTPITPPAATADRDSDEAPASPADPWIARLEDPAQVERALTELARLREPKAIEAIGASWRKHDHNPRALRVIIDIADQESALGWQAAVPVLGEAVERFIDNPDDSRAIDNATVAVDSLGRAAAKTHVDVEVVIRAVTLPLPPAAPGQRVRLAAIRALGSFTGEARATETLIAVISTDTDKQQVSLFAAAADALAHSPSPKAIDPLIEAMFRMPPLFQFCRRALVAIGAPAIPVLRQVLDLKHERMNAYAREQQFSIDCDRAMGPKTTCTAPTALEFKAAAILGDLHAKAAVPDLVAALKQPPLPAFFSYGDAGPNQHQAILDALKSIGDDRAADPVLDYIRAKDTDEYIKPMAIDTYSYLTRESKALPYLAKLLEAATSSFEVRVAAALAIGRLAREEADLAPLRGAIAEQRKSADKWHGLAAAAERDYDQTRSKRDELEAKIAEQTRKLTVAQERERKRLEEELAVKERDKLIATNSADDYRYLQRTLEQDLARAAVGIECLDDPRCYVAYLDRDDREVAERLTARIPAAGRFAADEQRELGLAVRDRALLELAKLGDRARAVTGKLLEHLPSTDRVIRQGVLRALLHAGPRPCKKCVTALDAIIADQENQSTLTALTADARVWRYYFSWAE